MPLSFDTHTNGSAYLPAPGFSDPVRDGQSCFRAILDATARPGRIYPVQTALLSAPKPLTPAMAAVCLTLLDTETHVWLAPGIDSPEVRQFLSFHCACPITCRPEEASFVLLKIEEAEDLMDRFHVGTAEYPDRAATLLLQTDNLCSEQGLTLTGPGIKNHHNLDITGCSKGFWHERNRANADFPTGLDFIFADTSSIACIPRTTQVQG